MPAPETLWDSVQALFHDYVISPASLLQRIVGFLALLGTVAAAWKSLILLWNFVQDIHSSWKVLGDLCEGRSVRFLATLSEFVKCLLLALRVGPLQMLQGFRFFDVARLCVEFDLVNPRSECSDEPELEASNPTDDKAAIDRRRARWEMAQKVHKARLSLYNGWPTHRRKILAAYMRMSKEGKYTEVEVSNIFHLMQNIERIKAYFEVLTRRKHDRNPERFLLAVKVECGFVAPLHLIAGLMSRFDEDWEPVMADFGIEIGRQTPAQVLSGDVFVNVEVPKVLRSYQMFIFDCWLLWGPSIPICTCKRWSGDHVALQFGFGDENNSLPLLQVEATEANETARFAELRRDVLDRPLAKYCSVTVRPCGSQVEALQVGKSLCTCQSDIRTKDMGPGIVLDYVSHVQGAADTVASGYYSAYLWAMFIICKVPQSGGPPQPVFGTDSHPWLGMVPFFEHGNIADAVTYRGMKLQLAGKILGAISRLYQDCGGDAADLRFCYACAIDDPGCGMESDIRTPRAFGESNGDTIGRTLSGMMKEMLAEDRFKDIHDKVIFDNAWQTRHSRYFSACHLPDVVRNYYEHLDKVKAELELTRAKRAR